MSLIYNHLNHSGDEPVFSFHGEMQFINQITSGLIKNDSSGYYLNFLNYDGAYPLKDIRKFENFIRNFNLPYLSLDFFVELIDEVIQNNKKYKIYADLPDLFSQLHHVDYLKSFVKDAILGSSCLKVPLRYANFNNSKKFLPENIMLVKELRFDSSKNHWTYYFFVPMANKEKVVVSFNLCDEISVSIKHLFSSKNRFESKSIYYKLDNRSFTYDQHEQMTAFIMNTLKQRTFNYYQLKLNEIDNHLSIDEANYLEIFELIAMNEC